MITQAQIPQADGDELSRLLGLVLLSEQHGHVAGQSIEEMQFSYYHCTTCGEVNFETDSHCTLRPLIPLDWDNAMKWRDWAVKKYGNDNYFRALYSVWVKQFNPHTDVNFEEWLSCYSGPKHYLQAAAICKLNAEKGN